MKCCTNKKWMLFIGLVLAMVIATAGMAISGIKGHVFEHGGKGHFKEKVLSRMDYTMQELNLTPAQQSQYKTIRARMSSDMDEALERHEKAHDTLHAEMSKTDPDIKGMAETLKQEINTMPRHLTLQIDSMIQMYDILDPGQQKQLVKKLKEHMDDERCS